MKLLVDFYKAGQLALKDGASLIDIRAMSIIGSMLKARMEVKDNEIEKLEQIGQMMREQFKSITGVKVSK